MIFPFILKIFFHIQHCIYMVQYYLHKINKWHCVVRSSFLFFFFFLFPTGLIFKNKNKNDKLKRRRATYFNNALCLQLFLFFFSRFQQHYLPLSLLLQSAVLSLPAQSCFHLYKNTTKPAPSLCLVPSKLPLISTLNAQTVPIMCQQQDAFERRQLTAGHFVQMETLAAPIYQLLTFHCRADVLFSRQKSPWFRQLAIDATSSGGLQR